MPPRVVLPRGRRRRPRVDHPGHGAHPRRADARRARVLGPRPAGPGHAPTSPTSPTSWTSRRDRQDLDLHDPRRRRLARRRAGHRRRRRVHRGGAQEPGRRGRRGRRLGRRHRRRRSTSRRSRLTLGTPIGGFLAAATQPLLPAHLLADVPFADLATSDFARLPGRQRPVRAHRPGRRAGDPRRRRRGVVPRARRSRRARAGAPPSVDSLATPVPQRDARPRRARTSTRSRSGSTRRRGRARGGAPAAGEVDAASGLSAATLGGARDRAGHRPPARTRRRRSRPCSSTCGRRTRSCATRRCARALLGGHRP